MPKAKQDFTAGRILPSQFDCEPPPDIREELRRPRRAQILLRPQTTERLGIWGWVLAALLCVSLLEVVMYNYSRQQQSAAPAVEVKPTPQPQPTPIPTPAIQA